MGFVKYATGIDYVKGALSKPVKKGSHTHGTYLIGTHREAATTNPKCTRLYIQDADARKRTTPLKPDEITLRARFVAVAQAVANRRKDLTKITTDQESFLEQRDLPTGKKTMKAYLWDLEMQTYDATHPRS